MNTTLLEPEILSAPQVCRAFGLSYRQLDYWVREGLITPTVQAHGSGTRRVFDAEAIEQVRRLVRAREVLRRLRGRDGATPQLADAAALAEPGRLEIAEQVLEAVGL